MDSKLTRSRLLNKSNVKRMVLKPPPCGSKSLSTSEVSPSFRMHKRKESGFQNLGLCGVVDGRSEPTIILDARIS